MSFIEDRGGDAINPSKVKKKEAASIGIARQEMTPEERMLVDERSWDAVKKTVFGYTPQRSSEKTAKILEANRKFEAGVRAYINAGDDGGFLIRD